ncbi:MAG: 4-(cytidine 5'-diphospho)-2-C-methyl-D-erythritol kinase [Buchnera aphidicola (Brevicoryne brassicae)]|uniref:4-diphosphocytidyl-2-C-methyl-D-erythritol kinase n=1 Tax=Buchnera aphidicola (Brevicoryne brassicae) TaxID=911343 RepID=A0AAJ5PVK0_9GAMM|nr:4-(cytidine 5'-diphospho)-2-C-methyl-D-erythritol kinase [Buchnera aphidicola]QCI19748.1 4-(cytidine 5'-diphospho)-2-C-methyl-D-erythritol kinase [Buchnera aphidicola (Brevicoryne brassicae)]WAI19117.1 MAG: 4-(cytidine 5'-diphospho)-2-C-methyl-D-erythritol kinase [Buchnera aphidicola (Brevicoryne brassicae)]
MIYTWPSPAKINLFLYVTGRRLDGYHYIQTLFQFLNYSDTLKIIPNKTGKIKLFTKKKSLINIQNTIINAAELLKEKALLYKKIKSYNLGAKIFLNKIIPIGSGLGGGSSNAATTLVVLNKLWNTQFTLKELALFGLEIGADVPFFIMGKTSIGEGIGEILYPIRQEEKWYLIVYPNIRILTKNIFSSPYLIVKSPKKSIKTLLKSDFRNDFENILKRQFITIKKLIVTLSTYAPSRITGTGSCVFSEFNNKKDAEKVFSLLPKNMRGFITKSVNISPLHSIVYKRKDMFF